MEMSGGSGIGEYYGVAFAPQPAMMNADVYFCISNALLSGVIRQRGQTPPLFSLPAQITNTAFETTNGVNECTFQRAASVTKDITIDTPRDFNLVTENFNILQARGPYRAAGNMISTHGPGQNRYASPQAFNFTTVSDSTATTTTTEATTMSTPPSPSDVCSTTGPFTPNCFSRPAGCVPLVDVPCTFARWTANNVTNTVDIEMIGGVPELPTDQYVAFAFGTVNRMEDADLYFCTENGLASGVIRERRQTPTIFDATTGLSNIRAELTPGGFIRCTFTRAGSVTKVVSDDRSVDFDIFGGTYYILIATGITNSDGGPTLHSPDGRAVSDFAIDFRSGATAYFANFYVVLALQMLLLGVKMF